MGDGDNLQGKGFSDRTASQPATNGSEIAPDPQSGIPFIRQVLSQIKAAQRTVQDSFRSAQEQQQQNQLQRAKQRQLARMQQYLNSGDPILVAEALAWQNNGHFFVSDEPGD